MRIAPVVLQRFYVPIGGDSEPWYAETPLEREEIGHETPTEWRLYSITYNLLRSFPAFL